MSDLAIRPAETDSADDLLDGRYEILSCLGAGGMGVIHKARDHRLDRDVAVKQLREDLRSDSQAVRRFKDEAKIAAMVDHPHAVTVHDGGEVDGLPYLVMELLPGRRLSDELNEGPVSPRRAREIAQGLLGALGEAHRVGIVHRDIKPSNVLIGWNDEPLLSDFGIAKSDEDLDRTCTSEIVGTAAYVAPERIEGKPATPQADIYAVGVLLYEALTGERPFDADTPIGVLNSIANHEPRPIDELRDIDDRALVDLVATAMAKNPDDRFASAGEMLEALDGKTPVVRDPEPALEPDDETVALTATMVFPMGSIPVEPQPEPSPPIPEPGPQPNPIQPEPSPPVPDPTPEPNPVQPEPSPPIPDPLPDPSTEPPTKALLGAIGRGFRRLGTTSKTPPPAETPRGLRVVVPAVAMMAVAWLAEPDARGLANLDELNPPYAPEPTAEVAEPPQVEAPPEPPPVDQPAPEASEPRGGNGKAKGKNKK